MANPFEVGQEIRLQAAGRPLRGTIRELSLTTALIAFEMPTELPLDGMLEWPDGSRTPVDLADRQAKVELVVRVPIPEYRAPASEPVVAAAAAPQQDDPRKALRIDIKVPLRLADPAVTGPLVSGQSLNLSTGGALILADSPLIVGREYVCQLVLTGETVLVRARPIRRMGHNSYAVRFMAAPEVGHRLMRRVFAMIRTGSTPLKRSSMNFRKS
ncbi:MAG: hypothetical protein KGR26_05215 [Cyanobacteria bacterium REEB65]|nr:hypothetical protein [Cyanobacteria bacterium REEB65]